MSCGAIDLIARNHWIFSGTPIQNDLKDFGSLINFLRVENFQHNAFFTNHITRPYNIHDGNLPILKYLLHENMLRRIKKDVLNKSKLAIKEDENLVSQQQENQLELIQ